MPQTWSAYVDVVSADGSRALIVRVSHDPLADRAELWVHFFCDGRLFAHMSAHACPPMMAALTGDAHQQVEFDTAGASLQARVLVSETERSVFGEGSLPLSLTMRWSEEGARGSNLDGRDERLVQVSASVTLDGRRLVCQGWGHRHTQVQEQPRFALPFSYLSLRGEEIGVVGLIGRKAQRGFGVWRGEALQVTGLALTEPALERRLSVDLSHRSLQGILRRSYRYWIPMGGTWRDGSIVTGVLGGLPVSGVVNDYAGPAG